MRWGQNVSRKVKAALLLCGVLLAVLANNLWERSSFQELDRSVSSIYDDRLLPETYIFKLTDHMYRKRLLWSEASRPGRAEAVRTELAARDAAIGMLVKEFEATYLVAEESQALRGFAERWAACRELERQWCAAPSGELEVAMTGEFDKALHQLGLLSEIQEHVGKDLKTGSKSLLASASAFSELEISLLVILCLMIQMLLSGKALTPPEPGHSHPS
jgi:hypothetical protein